MPISGTPTGASDPTPTGPTVDALVVVALPIALTGSGTALCTPASILGVSIFGASISGVSAPTSCTVVCSKRGLSTLNDAALTFTPAGSGTAAPVTSGVCTFDVHTVLSHSCSKRGLTTLNTGAAAPAVTLSGSGAAACGASCTVFVAHTVTLAGSGLATASAGCLSALPASPRGASCELGPRPGVERHPSSLSEHPCGSPCLRRETAGSGAARPDEPTGVAPLLPPVFATSIFASVIFMTSSMAATLATFSTCSRHFCCSSLLPLRVLSWTKFGMCCFETGRFTTPAMSLKLLPCAPCSCCSCELPHACAFRPAACWLCSPSSTTASRQACTVQPLACLLCRGCSHLFLPLSL